MTLARLLPRIEERIDLVETTLAPWKDALAKDYPGYRNHVYRVIHFCFAFRECSEEERRKIILAACFHDLGIWSGRTFDYLPPSVAAAKEYLARNRLEGWSEEIELMIDEHHKLRRFKDDRFPLVEVLRRADLVDVSLGLRSFGLARAYVRSVRRAFPNAGLHKRLVRLAGQGLRRRPLRPLPFYKW